MRQLFISVAKPTTTIAACGKGETSRNLATLNRLPRIKCLVCPQEVLSVLTKQQSWWMLLYNTASFPHPWTIRVKSFRENLFSARGCTLLQMCDGYWMKPPQTSGSVQLDQLLGHLFHLIRVYLTTFYGVTLKQLCTHGNHVLWMNLRIKNTIHEISEQQLKNVIKYESLFQQCLKW
jgi:hypothetical protein